MDENGPAQEITLEDFSKAVEARIEAFEKNSLFRIPSSSFPIPTSAFKPFRLRHSKLFPFKHRLPLLKKSAKSFHTILGFSDYGTALFFNFEPLFEAFILSGRNRF